MDSKKSKVVDYFLLGKRIRRFRKEKNWSQQLPNKRFILFKNTTPHLQKLLADQS